MKRKSDINWPVTILLILGLVTIIFPLYMTVVIAFKQPSEMTNSISGILSLPKSWSLDNFAEAMRDNGFLAFIIEQCACYGRYRGYFHRGSFTDRLCHRPQQGKEQIL